ncbi:MAG: SDR family NAD(P)-dependent oxidoreductase [Myxococcota bacterium]
MRERIAWVTGGTRGIGKEIVNRLAASGARVYATYVSNEAEAKAVERDWASQGWAVDVRCVDSRDRSAVERLVAEIDREHGRLDVLVNNAGINKPTDFDQITDEDWDEILSVNLKGPFVCTQVALPLLKASGKASVINVGSVSGQYGGPRTAHYAASKAGMISLSQVIARFGAKSGIRCNTLAAGFVDSEMTRGSLGSPAVQAQAESVLLGRFADPKEIAAAAFFLATEESSYVTGQTLAANGGLYF